MQQPYFPGPAGPPPAERGFPTWALVLILTAGSLLLLGVVAVVLAMVGVRSYIAASKTAEALNSIGQISRSASTAYDADDPVTGVPRKALCGSASHPVPVSVTMVSARKYQSGMTDWTDSPGRGWSCLEFEMTMPQYYQYDYRVTGTGSVPGDKYTAVAHGDLDGDGVTSSFELDGEISPSGLVVVAPTPRITDEKE